MHDTAQRYAQLFNDTYIHNTYAEILEVGSQDHNGTLRNIFHKHKYIGADHAPGPGVDHVLSDPYHLPYKSETKDIIICSSVLEHCDMFWLLFDDMCRVLRNHGMIFINVPSNGDFHRFPVDCWRFYPDAGKALEKWARHCGHDITLLESFVGHQDQDIWNDFVAVFCKGNPEVYPKRIVNCITDYDNALVAGNDQYSNYSPRPEDRRRLIG